MNNSTVNFTTPETSTNSTTQSFVLVESLNLYMYCINFMFGLPIHCYVIWLIVTGTGSGVTSEFFILNLSVCEIGTCLNSLFCVLNKYNWFLNLTTFLIGLGITGRPLLQCLMCVERYLAVVHPVTFLKYKPLRYRVTCCSVVWIITLGSCFCCVFTIDLFYIYVCFLLLQFLLFLSIQLFCCLAVLRALKQSGPGERGSETEEKNHMKRRAFHIILISIVSMVIMYVPFTVSAFLLILTQHYIKEMFFFSSICNVLAGFVQPVLYLNRAGKLLCLRCS